MTDTAGTLDRDHPIETAVSSVRSRMTSVAEVPAWTLDGALCRDLLVELAAAQAQLTELEARVLAQATSVGAGEETGATSTATWLAHTTRQTRPVAHGQTRLATGLATHELTRSAMTAGDVLPDQARVIIDAVEALPHDPAVRAQCETHLIGEAAHHDAQALRILGRHVLDVIDPEAGEAHEAALLETEELDAAKATRLTITRDGTGKVHGRFTLPELQGAMLEKALRAIAAPKHHRSVHGPGTYDHERPTPERLGQAFAEYVEHYPADRLPDAGGVNATVVVTMTLDSLTGGLGSAVLDSGDRISAGAARMLACEAGLVPSVLGSGSVVLDQGRRTRFHTGAQRLALTVQQKHCQAPGCDTPATLCHTHHTTPWTRGGHTDLTHAQLLCPKHHHQAHRHIDVPMRT